MALTLTAATTFTGRHCLRNAHLFLGQNLVIANLPSIDLPWIEKSSQSAPVDPLAKFHYRQLNSPRINKKMLGFTQRRNCSSHTLNIPNSLSPSTSRKHTSDQTDSNSAQNSPVNFRRLNLNKDSRPRPRSLSDDRMNSNEDELCHLAALLPSDINNDKSTHHNDRQDPYQIEMDEHKPFICDSAII